MRYTLAGSSFLRANVVKRVRVWPSEQSVQTKTWLDNEDGNVIANSPNTRIRWLWLAKPRCKIIFSEYPGVLAGGVR